MLIALIKIFLMKDFIEVKGARVHNLKNIDILVPLNKIVGIAGVSGSGKSSLALGVLYAEGSRRYLDALSTYTRRRISQASIPQVDSIENIPAALALHQRPGIPDIRSTFGTSTELLNCLRLMYSRLGSYCCPNGHYLKPSMNVAISQPLVCPECGEIFNGLGAEEYSFNSDGACQRCSGTGVVREVDDSKLVPDTSKTLEEGAVESWNMFGISWMYRVAGELGVRVNVPFKDLTEEEKQIVYNGDEVNRVIMIPSKNGKLFELNCAYRNAHKAVEEALRKAETEKGLERIEKYLSTMECPECHGSRLNKKASSTLLCGLDLPTASKMTLDNLIYWIKKVPSQMPSDMQPMAESIVNQFLDMAKHLINLGLGYLSLDRRSSTLSTGERQRMQLAKSVRNRTTGVLYVLDEPSIGLHPANVDGLINIMHDLVNNGNSVVLVDHDIRILRHSDYLIEMGPKAGKHGGSIIAKGTIDEIEKNSSSIIGKFLSGEENAIVRKRISKNDIFAKGSIEMLTNPLHTVHALDVKIPKERLTVITGVSGSGKTTLILESLVPALEAVSKGLSLPKHVVSINANGINRINLIDASPIGANVRSTVATYANIHDDLRKLFALADLAKEGGFKANDFSYNTGKLRCPTCDGTGQISMDLQFLPDVDIVCPDCNGSRYSKTALEIKHTFNNASISLPELMSLTVDEAMEKLIKQEKIYDQLNTLSKLGLGYLTLGEATPLLSGGEAQRLKLASEIGKTQKQTVFVFDEPTIGLHPLDTRLLISVFQKLIDAGATVIVIDHDLDMIANADYIIDMGPEGGESGGEIVATGMPEEIAKNDRSITGRYLNAL